MSSLTIRSFAAAAAATLILSMAPQSAIASALPREAAFDYEYTQTQQQQAQVQRPQVAQPQNQQVPQQQVQQVQVQNGGVATPRVLACFTGIDYNVGGATCEHECTTPYTAVCVDQCCGSELTTCTDQCTYIAAEAGVQGALPACTNGCVGNAMMNVCEENCDTNGAAIPLPACTSNCRTAATAPLCTVDCYTYA